MTNERSAPLGISKQPSKTPPNQSPSLQPPVPLYGSSPLLFGDAHSDDDDFGLSGLQASFSSDDDSTFERVSSDEDDSDFESCPYDGSFHDDLSDDEHDEQDHSPQPIPHWFAHEDTFHIEAIFKLYGNQLISPGDFMRSHQPFIGRIRRQASSMQGDFQTLDEVEICNCQRVKADALLPPIKTVFVATSWDRDGMPYSFFKLETREQLHLWELRVREDVPPSYLYCSPDWFNQAEAACTTFVYKSSAESLGVTYANVPWERTAYHFIARNNQLPLRSSSSEWDETFGSPPAF